MVVLQSPIKSWPPSLSQSYTSILGSKHQTLLCIYFQCNFIDFVTSEIKFSVPFHSNIPDLVIIYLRFLSQSPRHSLAQSRVIGAQSGEAVSWANICQASSVFSFYLSGIMLHLMATILTYRQLLALHGITDHHPHNNWTLSNKLNPSSSIS